MISYYGSAEEFRFQEMPTYGQHIENMFHLKSFGL